MVIWYRWYAHSYMVSSIPNTNNLHKVVWFQVFLSDTNKLYTIIWSQATIPIYYNNHLFEHSYIVSSIPN